MFKLFCEFAFQKPLIDFTQEYQFVNIICNFDFLKLVQSGLLSHDGARLVPSPQNFRCAIYYIIVK